MKNFRVTNGFPSMSDLELLGRARGIGTAITGNPNFPTPVPTLAIITASINDFQEAVDAAENGDSQLILIRDQKREALIDNLHLLGNYVLFTAAGDVVVAASSGFGISKP